MQTARSCLYNYAMIVPPFVGQDFLKTTGLADDKGYIKVLDTYQTPQYANVYAVGIAAAVDVPWQTVPVGIPKTGFPTEQMAHVAAKNVVSQIRGGVAEDHKEFGDIKGDLRHGRRQQRRHDPRRQDAAATQARRPRPGPQNHAMKVGFEKYSLWKMKAGHVGLP